MSALKRSMAMAMAASPRSARLFFRMRHFPWPHHEHLPIANAPMRDPIQPLPRKTQCSAIYERLRTTADLPTCRPADLPTCRPADLPPILADIVSV
jgi:hypothetical protein